MKYALANTYALKLNNTNKKTEVPKDDLLLNEYNDTKDELFLFKDGSFLVGKKGEYNPIIPNIPMEINIKKNAPNDNYLHIVYSRCGDDFFKDDPFSARHLFIHEDGCGYTVTGDMGLSTPEHLNDLEMVKMTNQIGLDLKLIQRALKFINKQSNELHNILISKKNPEEETKNKKKEKKGKKRKP